MAASTKLEKLYRSAPDGSIQLQTLEIFHPVMAAPLRIYSAGQDVNKDFRLESGAPRDAGASVSFTAATFEIEEPDAQTGGDNSVSTVRLGLRALKQINEIVDALEASAVQFLTEVEFIYRVYEGTETDIGPSIDPPVTQYGESITLDPTAGASITITTTNNKRRATGEIYTVEKFPGVGSSA
jgi:hypothetical protein